MQHKKSTSEDLQMLHDESADPVERSSAIARLVADGFNNFEETLVELLNHPHFILRGEAIKVLLSKWRLAKYMNHAVRMLHADSEWSVRADAAYSMSSFTQRTGKQRELVTKELVRCLLQDEDWATQKSCYEELVKLLAPDKANIELPDRFNPDRDVDWDLLKPYLNKSQIPHTQVLR